MRKIFIILPFVLLSLLAGGASGSFWFQVIDVSPIKMTPNSEANFTVAVKGLGSQGAYVQLLFRNTSQGLSITCPRMIKYVFPAGVTEYNCTVKTGDIAPGNYSFVVDVAAKGSPSGKRTAYVEVEAAQRAIPAAPTMGMEPREEPAAAQSNQTQEAAKGTPGPGIVLAALAIMMAAKKMRS